MSNENDWKMQIEYKMTMQIGRQQYRADFTSLQELYSHFE